MYQVESSYDEALKIYLKLCDSKGVFELISKFDHFQSKKKKFPIHEIESNRSIQTID